MRRMALVTLLVFTGCAAGQQTSATRDRTLPEPLVQTELPTEPDEVSGSERVVEPVQVCTTDEEEPREVGPGIYMSDAMAHRAAELSIRYDELRSLYEIDIRTWGREREIYERMLLEADDQVEHWMNEAERSLWEQHDGQVGLVIGLVLGAGASAAAALLVGAVSE